MISKAHDVGLVVPTFNGGSRWADCLAAIKRQSMSFRRLLVIDSGSTDGTASLARAEGFEVLQIDQSQFNHGATRQWAAEYLSDCEILVFLTQDAVLSSESSVSEIVNMFDDSEVAVAYGRQLPHRGAARIEAHAREFNYRSETQKKNLKTVGQLGPKVFFCSNSFAAYRRASLLALGGFRSDLILGEDMEFAARAIKAGFANAYCATATVYHSHDYSVWQTLSRYFDIGVFDEQNQWMTKEWGSHKGEGLRFIRSELRYLSTRAAWLIPLAACQTAAKLVGYRLGLMQKRLPVALKRKLSMMPKYWK